MAVPKKKTSKQKRNSRRSHHALKKTNVIIDRVTGDYRLPHHLSKADGTYNNLQIVSQEEEKDNE